MTIPTRTLTAVLLGAMLAVAGCATNGHEHPGDGTSSEHPGDNKRERRSEHPGGSTGGEHPGSPR